LRLHVRPQIAVDVVDEILLWRIVSAGFAQRRKTLFNNLRHAPSDLLTLIEKIGGAERALGNAGIEATRRAETLTFEEWGRLTCAIETASKPAGDE